jgi:hypothetical protein
MHFSDHARQVGLIFIKGFDRVIRHSLPSLWPRTQLPYDKLMTKQFMAEGRQ